MTEEAFLESVTLDKGIIQGTADGAGPSSTPHKPPSKVSFQQDQEEYSDVALASIEKLLYNVHAWGGERGQHTQLLGDSPPQRKTKKRKKKHPNSIDMRSVGRL